MRAFRERWSHPRVLVAAPEEHDPGDLLITTALWGCETDLVWRVIGGSKLLAELRAASYGPPEFPESLPESLGPAQRPDSLFLCTSVLFAYRNWPNLLPTRATHACRLPRNVDSAYRWFLSLR